MNQKIGWNAYFHDGIFQATLFSKLKLLNCKNSFPLIVTTIVSYITEDKNVGKGVCPSLKDYRSMGLEYQIFYFSP